MTSAPTITLLRLRLRAGAPFAVGSGHHDAEIDLPLIRDADGTPWVPPSSVAGALRSHLRSAGLDDQLMGSAPPEAGEGSRSRVGAEDATVPSALRPSPLRVLGTEMSAPTGGSHGQDPQELIDAVGRRSQTAVDRRRAAARQTSLRRSEILPRGTELEIFLRLDRGIDEAEMAALTSWQPTLGRSRSTGFGRFVVENAWIGVLDLGVAEDLLVWLRGGGPDLHRQVATEPLDLAPPTKDDIVIEQMLEIVDGLAVGGGEPDGEKDRPVLRDPDGTPVIEGSSLKGVLRARAAYILRSLGEEVCDHPACGRCPICLLFGSATARSLVAVDRARIVGVGSTVNRSHVALDRFTGGAADRLLFDAEEVTSGTFVLRIRRQGELPIWALPLLEWCVKDIDDGLVGVGGLTSRGAGTVRAVGGPLPTPSPLVDMAFRDGGR